MERIEFILPLDQMLRPRKYTLPKMDQSRFINLECVIALWDSLQVSYYMYLLVTFDLGMRSPKRGGDVTESNLNYI